MVGATVYRVKALAAVVALVATSTPSIAGSVSIMKNVSKRQRLVGRYQHTWIIFEDRPQDFYPIHLFIKLTFHLVKDFCKSFLRFE